MPPEKSALEVRMDYMEEHVARSLQAIQKEVKESNDRLGKVITLEERSMSQSKGLERCFNEVAEEKNKRIELAKTVNDHGAAISVHENKIANATRVQWWLLAAIIAASVGVLFAK